MKVYPIIIALVLLLFSCNEVEKIQKSKNTEYKLQKANEFYDKRQYGKANTLYEELLSIYKGTNTFEGLYYKYAMSYYFQKSYLAASYHFKNFADLFPKSKNAEEAKFLHSKCLYRISPEYTLDQSNTVKAMSELQNFINTNPQAKQLDDANKMIDNSLVKLEEKDKYSAELYYKISQFQAAAVYFEQIMNKYPDSKNIDYYQLMVLKSRYNYAKRSITEKQTERFKEVLRDFAYFNEINPNNSYSSELKSIKTLSSQAIAKISKK
jgi:outer membrane protein assembly factor BamD